ncbi:MAG TPA: DnaJ family domain-containing protein [Candidatus Limnocylindria bacterium]|nr:DnaJ family domain-containing protein [Candidatus Limnocylindria bacterium]
MHRTKGRVTDDGPAERLRRLERRVDEQLRELAEAGELSGLPGEGAPLADDDPHAGDRWAARHVAINANVAPEFVEIRREISDRRDRLVRRLRAHREWLGDRAALLTDLPAERILDAARATMAADARVETELRDALAELNALVARHNLKVPFRLQVAPLSLEVLRERV